MNSAELSDNDFWNDALSQDLLYFLKNRIRCSDTAADLTHETYIKLSKRCKESPPDNARALAFRIALNLAIDYQRKASVRNRYNTDQSYDTALETSGNTISPEQTVIAKQQLASMLQALNELPTNCRTAFFLHSVEGLKYVEIAERMGISKSMVNKLLSQAMGHCALRRQKQDL